MIRAAAIGFVALGSRGGGGAGRRDRRPPGAAAPVPALWWEPEGGGASAAGGEWAPGRWVVASTASAAAGTAKLASRMHNAAMRTPRQRLRRRRSVGAVAPEAAAAPASV